MLQDECSVNHSILRIMPHDFSLSSGVMANGRTVHYAKLNGSDLPKFTIGNRTLYDGNIGLYNTQVLPGLVYNPAEYAAEFGFWAWFIYPTAMAESKGSYLCLNTYDRAKFTFSFMQYAAHVPNGDFVKFMRKLLALPDAGDYFPKLTLKDGHIFYRNANGILSQLESDTSTQGLMDYMNPGLQEIENQELICSARMVHWATHSAEHRRVQVATAIAHFRENMVEYSKRFNLNGVPAKVCQMVCDIRHQGRGMNDRIANAMNTDGNWELAFTNLCSIGSVNYSTRINTVRSTINGLLDSGTFNLKYHSADNSFS
jgi:hypothetical protein